MRKLKLLAVTLTAGVVFVGVLPVASAADHREPPVITVGEFVPNLLRSTVDFLNDHDAEATVDADDFAIWQRRVKVSPKARKVAHRIAKENGLRGVWYLGRLHVAPAEPRSTSAAQPDSFFDVWIDFHLDEDGNAPIILVPETLDAPERGTVIVFNGLEVRKGKRALRLLASDLGVVPVY